MSSSQSPTIKYINSFTVTGLTVRTQNSDEFNQHTAKLPKLWQQFYSSKFTPGATLYGVYSDYEADANGLYSVTAGVADDNQDNETSSVIVNSGNYLVFKGKGAMPQVVIETWKRVWDYFMKESEYQRSFMTDFEEYDKGDEVAIYIGVK